MSSMHEFFKRIKIRPFVYFGMLIISIVLSALEAYNPIIKNYGSLSYILEHNYIKTLSGWTAKVGEFFSSGDAVLVSMLTILAILALSAIVSVFLSGYINVLIYSVEDKQKAKGEFVSGIKRNYLKTFVYLFLTIILSAVLFFFVLYSAIPTVFLLKLFLDGDTGVIFTMLIVALLTIIVMLFCVLFYGMYLSYILPSIAGLRKKNIRSGIKMTNMYAWYLLPKTTLFLLIAAILRFLLFVIDYGSDTIAFSVIVLLVTAILRSILYYIYFHFVFYTFIAMREDLYPNYQEEIPAPTKHIARVPQQRKVQETVVEETQKTEKTEIIEDEYDDSFDM